LRGKGREIYKSYISLKIWGSPGSIVSDYGLDNRSSIPRQRQRIFLLASASRPALGTTQPPVQWVPGVLSPGVKRGLGRDADNAPPSSAEVENEELYLLSSRRLHGM
jgi:hypothetical protein